MINEIPDLFGGSALQAQETGEQPAMEDSLGYGHLLDSLPQDQPVQVAGVGNAVGRIFGRTARSLTNAVGNIQPPGAVVDRQLMEDALRTMAKERQRSAQSRRVDLEAQRQGGVPPVPIAQGAPSPRDPHGTSGEINLDRAHPGAPSQDYVALADKARQDPATILRMIRNADEMGDVLDVIGAGLRQAPRTHSSISDAGFDYAEVAKALTQEGLANDRQLYALRTMIATLGEKTALIARRIYEGNHSPDLLLQYEKTGQQLIAFTSFTKGQTREVARALSQQNMIADTLDGNDLRALDLALNTATGGDPTTLIKSASALVKNLDMGIDPASAFRGALERHTGFDAFVEFWKANNLSGFATQGYNLASGPVVMFAETASRAAGAVVGEARHAMGLGADEYYSAGEFGEALVGGLTGVRNSLQFFWHTLVTGESRLGAYGGKEVGSSAIQEKIGAPLGLDPNVTEAVTTPAFRVMRAVDEGMMLPAFTAELSSLAYRDGKFRLGLTGQALADHVDRILQDPPYQMHQDAKEQGRKVVMQASSEDENNAGLFTQTGEVIHRLVRTLPVLQFVFPWIKTPARIMDYQVESSALAAVSPRLWRQVLEGGAQGDIAAGKMVMGVGFTALMWPMVSSMQITGGGPENPEQRAALVDLGWQPYSIKVGNTYVSYRNWSDPVIGVMAGVATALERARFGRLQTDVTRDVMTGASSAATYMVEASYMEGLKKMVDAFGDERKLAQFAASIATGAVPYGGALASVARMGDEADRARSLTKSPGFGGEGYVEDMFNVVKQEFMLRLPGLRDQLRPARYWDGKVKMPEGPDIVKTLSPFRMHELRSDPASTELVRHGVNVREPSSRFDFGTAHIQIELLDLDGGKGLLYDNYVKLVGKTRREFVETTIGSYDYQNATPPEQALMLDKAIALGARGGEGLFWEETLLPLVEAGHPGLEKSGRELGMDLPQFVQLLMEQRAPGVRAIVPQSRRKIEVPPALEFK